MKSTRTNTQGMTFIEVMAAVVIIGFLASGLQHAAHLILQTDAEANPTRIIHELGISLLEEVAATAFDDPQTGSTTLGPDDGEWETTVVEILKSSGGSPVPLEEKGGTPGDIFEKNRSEFDDVDDYTVWDGAYELQHKDGTGMNTSGYTRAVTVTYVNSTNFDLLSITPTDHKRITVSVQYEKVPMGSFTTVRVQGGRNVDVSS